MSKTALVQGARQMQTEDQFTRGHHPVSSPRGTHPHTRGAPVTVPGTRARSWLRQCPTLCKPMDCSPPGSSVQVILQARILEWVSMPSCRGSFQPRDCTHISCISCIAGSFLATAPLGKPTEPGGPHTHLGAASGRSPQAQRRPEGAQSPFTGPSCCFGGNLLTRCFCACTQKGKQHVLEKSVLLTAPQKNLRQANMVL